MKVYISSKIKAFRVCYLIVSLGICLFTGTILVENVRSGFQSSLSFNDVVRIISLLLSLLFEISIVLFIIRSMKSQTLLMKNLVFKPDGTPFKPGIVLVSSGGVLFTILSGMLLYSAYVGRTIYMFTTKAQIFIADVMLIFGINLLFSSVYYFAFRHESGTFELI